MTSTIPTTVASADAPPVHGASITDFLTDGSLPAACEALSRLSGTPVQLVDPSGRAVISAPGNPAWRFDPARSAIAPVKLSVPLVVDGKTIGAIQIGEQAGAPDGTGLERVVRLLVQTAAGFCAQDLELRHSVREVQALARMSSHLARATDVDQVLDIALDSALELLGLHAGSIVLFEDERGLRAENEADLVYKLSTNLSQEWLDCPQSVSRDRIFDRLALRGEIVVSEDLLADDRVQVPDLVRLEGLRSFINCGMLFQNKPIGIIRLYSRQPRTFSEPDKRLLRSIAQQAAVSVEQARLLRVKELDARLQRQLAVAADVQRRMLPVRVPTHPRLDAAARYEPSSQLGGDFFDLFDLNGHLGLAIGDVVGKGIAAALFMSAIRASLRAHVQDLYHLDEAIARVNAALCRDTRDDEFATLWYGVVDPATLRLTYCCAGHDPPFIVRTGSTGERELIRLEVGGMAVGIDPSQRYPRETFELRADDVLVAYTDGLTDALNFSGDRFGRARLHDAVLAILRDEPQAPAVRVIEHVFWSLRQFAGLQPRPDDQTIVVLRVRA